MSGPGSRRTWRRRQSDRPPDSAELGRRAPDSADVPGRAAGSADLPGRLLAAAAATLPEHRRDWGRAMTAELQALPDRRSRWWFALGTARAALALPPAGGWTAPALTAVVAVAAVVVVWTAVTAVVPNLGVFAATFTGLLGAMVVLAVVRARRFRLMPSVVAVAGVVAAITSVVEFLRHEPAAAAYFPPAAAVYLAVALAACLWVGTGSAHPGPQPPPPHSRPRPSGTTTMSTVSRLRLTARRPRDLDRAAVVGVLGAAGFVGWFALAFGTDGAEPAWPLTVLLGALLLTAPAAAFVLPAYLAARSTRSRRAGLRATVWTACTAMPLTYAVWLPLAMHRHALDGRTLDGELAAPVGANLADALVFAFGIFPVLALAAGLVGAACGARAGVARAPG